MKTLVRESSSYEDTLALGTRLAGELRPGDVVCLYGDLGAGKTALVKGIARGLDIDPNKVHSPTFTLMNVYEGKWPLYHFDLYRINAGDLLGIGYEEYFYGQGITAIEWSERLGALLPEVFWKVALGHVAQEARQIGFSFQGVALEARFNRFKV